MGENEESYEGVGENDGDGKVEGSTEDKGYCDHMFVYSQFISQSNKA